MPEKRIGACDGVALTVDAGGTVHLDGWYAAVCRGAPMAAVAWGGFGVKRSPDARISVLDLFSALACKTSVKPLLLQLIY